uniref:Uncharacterized protein n=1 Tax=Chlamydomonas leiostraca TaxID=1034604 RepID=A0A7S0RMN2_9CHLO
MRGAGMTRTTLLLRKSMTDLYGQAWTGARQTNQTDEGTDRQSDWKNGPGLIRFVGPDWQATSSKLADVTAYAKRGSRTLAVSTLKGIKVGSLVTLVMSDVGGMLHTDMNFRSARAGCQATCWTTPRALRFHSRVAAVDAGAQGGPSLTLERALPLNVSVAWQPEVWSYAPGVSEVGIEDMRIEHKWAPYPGHLEEEGWNGLEFSRTSNCWARNVAIVNGDNSLGVSEASFCTFQNIQLSRTAARARDGKDCHHGLNVSASQDILVADWAIGMRCWHDATVFNWTLGVAWVNGSGYDLALDHHRLYPYATLWSNIALGQGTRPWSGGGITPWGTGTSSFATFWNLRASKPISQALPVWDLGHRAAFVGVDMGPAVDAGWNRGAATQQGWVRQDLPGLPSPTKALWPPDLYSAQLAWRTAQEALLSKS